MIVSFKFQGHDFKIGQSVWRCDWDFSLQQGRVINVNKLLEFYDETKAYYCLDADVTISADFGKSGWRHWDKHDPFFPTAKEAMAHGTISLASWVDKLNNNKALDLGLRFSR